MKRFLCFFLCLVMVFAATGAMALNTSDFDLTVAQKLYMQVTEGSGFSGDMQLEIRSVTDDAVLMSIPFEWDYIHVLEQEQTEEEHRLSLHLLDGENAAADAYVQYKDQTLRFQSTLLGEDWYELPFAPALISSVNADAEATAEGGNGLAETFGIPEGMVRFLPVLLQSFAPSDDNMPLLTDRFLTKLDIWLEGYRNSAEVGKLEDGTGTIEVSYSISPSNVKAQLKQMIVDMLADEAVVEKLRDFFGGDIAGVYLNPAWQPYYLAAVDALEMEDNLTIDRKVAFSGETISLALSLPYSDPVMGDCTLIYSREMGEDQQPLNQICIETENRVLTLEYMEYSSLTDVSVLQGTVSSLPAENTEGAADPVSFAFVLTTKETQTKNDEGYLVHNVEYQLSLAPDEESDTGNQQGFEPLTVELKAEFSSKEPAKAATQIKASLALYEETGEEKLVLHFQGKTRVKWTPAALPEEILAISSMTDEERSALTQKLLGNLLPLLLPYQQNLDLSDASLGIIGGADGPTSIFISEDAEQTPDATTDEPATESPEETPDAQ